VSDMILGALDKFQVVHSPTICMLEDAYRWLESNVLYVVVEIIIGGYWEEIPDSKPLRFNISECSGVWRPSLYARYTSVYVCVCVCVYGIWSIESGDLAYSSS